MLVNTAETRQYQFDKCSSVLSHSYTIVLLPAHIPHAKKLLAALLDLMSKRTSSSAAAVDAKPAVKSKPTKQVVRRTMQTRTKNAEVNPLDLEGPSSDEEKPPRRPVQKRKRRTAQEKVAAEKKHDDALAMVGSLEEDIAQQANLETNTPRAVPTEKQLPRNASYECPDPSLVAAKPKPKPKSKRIPALSRTVISSEDEDIEELPPAKKKRRPLIEQLDIMMKAKRVDERSTGKDSATVLVSAF